MNVTRRLGESKGIAPPTSPERRELDGFTDARLVEMMRSGKKSAFEEIVYRYQRPVGRMIANLVRDQHLIEDVTQEVFIKVAARIHQFDTARRLGPWILQIGVNAARDALRKAKRRIRFSFFSQKTDDDPQQFDAPTVDPRSEIDMEEEVRVVLDKLPEKYRTVLILRDFENYSTSEIAAILCRKEPTIRWRLAEAREKFRAIWIARTGQAPRTEVTKVETDDLCEASPADRVMGRK